MKIWREKEKKGDDDKTDREMALSPENTACGPDQNPVPINV